MLSKIFERILTQPSIRLSIRYGVENIHLINAAQESPTAVRLNINADEPVSPSPVNFGNTSPFYNYTALLTGLSLVKISPFDLDYLGALVRAKIDLEQLYDNRSVHSPVHWHQNSVHDEPNRFLFVLLGIVLVGLIFGATVLFFQRMYVTSIGQYLHLLHLSF